MSPVLHPLTKATVFKSRQERLNPIFQEILTDYLTNVDVSDFTPASEVEIENYLKSKDSFIEFFKIYDTDKKDMLLETMMFCKQLDNYSRTIAIVKDNLMLIRYILSALKNAGFNLNFNYYIAHGNYQITPLITRAYYPLHRKDIHENESIVPK